MSKAYISMRKGSAGPSGSQLFGRRTGAPLAQSGRAPRSGRGGRRFKSCHSDHSFRRQREGRFPPHQSPREVRALAVAWGTRSCPRTRCSFWAVATRRFALQVKTVTCKSPMLARLSEVSGLDETMVACVAERLGDGLRAGIDTGLQGIDCSRAIQHHEEASKFRARNTDCAMV